MAAPWNADDFDQVLAGIAAAAAEHDRDGSFPHGAFVELHRVGLLGWCVPAAMGGSGAGLAEASRIVERVGSADPSVGLLLSQHYLFHAMLAAGAWPRPQTEAVQRSAVEDGALINALRVEPELGTPARGGMPATVAARRADDGGGWSLRGHKIYATGIPALRWLAVWARTDDADPLMGMFLVPAETPGIGVIETWDHLGMRATASHDVVFEDTRVGPEAAVDVRPPAEWATPDPVLSAWNAMLIAALYHGVALAARDWLIGYLNERTPSNLGAPLATLPRFQLVTGEIEAVLHTSGRLLQSAAHDVDDAGGPALAAAAQSAALVKHTVTANAVRAVELALSLVGNPGLSRHQPLERHYRNVLCSRIHTPQDDTILTVAGRQALGR